MELDRLYRKYATHSPGPDIVSQYTLLAQYRSVREDSKDFARHRVPYTANMCSKLNS